MILLNTDGTNRRRENRVVERADRRDRQLAALRILVRAALRKSSTGVDRPGCRSKGAQ